MLYRTIFVGKPNPNDRGHRGGLYEYKRDDINDNMSYYCNGDQAETYRLMNAILDKTDDSNLLKLIYEYGEAVAENARQDEYEIYAGESI